MKADEINKKAGCRKPDKLIFTGIVSIWLILSVFWLVTALYPAMLTDISDKERHYEAGLYINLGISQAVAGNMPDAIENIEKAISIAPDMPEARINSGVLYKQNGDYQKAISQFNEALKLHPEDSSNIYANISDIYRESGDSISACAYISMAINSNPFFIDRLMMEGDYHMNCINYHSASISFKKALDARYNILYYYEDMLIDKIRSKDNGFNEKRRIKELLAKGISKEDMKLYSPFLFMKMLKKDRSLAENLNKLGCMHAKLNDVSNARTCFERALAIWPEYPDAYDNMKYISTLE